ncbi:TPA: transposase [Stenotrophomonas maltophilia]|nr:transposase [Stenotrophomonas maltophilia]
MPSPRLLKGRWPQSRNVYAITTITHRRQRFFDDADLAALAVATLQRLQQEGRYINLAWVVMPDHIHWLMQLRGGTLAASVQIMKSRCSRLSGTDGPLWQRGYYDHAVRCDESLRSQALYIAANPVRAGLAEQLGEYPFAWCRWFDRAP